MAAVSADFFNPCQNLLSFKKKKSYGLGMVAHICNPSTQELGQEDLEFKASLVYTVRPCLKKKKK
jgi:hypothetical protein